MRFKLTRLQPRSPIVAETLGGVAKMPAGNGLGLMLVSMFRTWRLLALMLVVAPVIAACATNHGSGVRRKAFSSREFGVAVSPRVFRGKYPPHGGGRYLPGDPYVVRGVTYRPVDGPG